MRADKIDAETRSQLEGYIRVHIMCELNHTKRKLEFIVIFVRDLKASHGSSRQFDSVVSNKGYDSKARRVAPVKSIVVPRYLCRQ